MAGEVLDSYVRDRPLVRDRAAILRERFERLPAVDKNLFQSGPFVLALNSSFCGLIANNYLRSALNVTQARFASTLPMAFLPFVSTLAVYELCVSQPIMQGDINCATCIAIRGGVIGAFIGCLYPALTAIPLNGGLAARYSTAPLPSKGNMLQYWMTVCKPAYRKLRYAAILQAALGTYFASKYQDIYIKMLLLPEPGMDPEELHD
ncbi:transmembrane protein 126A-like [Paroedura picta]|uniref:transmembrane protein 126A-like n=1 Tax=Paroedura picta TaxID=143630 RepID=UPI004056A56F